MVRWIRESIFLLGKRHTIEIIGHGSFDLLKLFHYVRTATIEIVTFNRD